MTARFAAPLSALVLLAAVSHPVSGAQVAELVPVDPGMPPSAYYGTPAPESEVVVPSQPSAGATRPGPSGKPAPDAKPVPDGKTAPAEIEDGWEGGAAKDKDGKFAYCVVEAGFTSGHVLMIARSQKGETNIGIGIPGAEMPPGEKWPVKVEVDGKLKRERVAMAPQPDMLVVSNGRDEELVTALMNGKELAIASASDRIVFALKGTKKVLADLKTCVDKGGNVPPIKTSTGKAPTAPQARLPEGLASLLAAAGVHDAEMVPLDKVPAERRPADVAWRFGPVVGGIRERMVAEGAKLDELSGSFADTMKTRCEGTGTVTLNPVEQAGTVGLRTGAVDCAMKQGTLHVSMTFLLSQGRLFTVLFHEAGERDVALVDKVRDNLAQVLRKAGTNATSTPAAGAAPSAPDTSAAPATPAPVATPAPAAGPAPAKKP